MLLWLRQASALSRSLYFALMVISMVCGGWSIPGVAIASIPNSPSILASASAAAAREPCSWILSFAGSMFHSMTTPVGYKNVAAAIPCKGSMSHPASLSGAARTRANISLPGVDGDALTVPCCFGSPTSLAVSSCCWACVNERGASRASILTRANRSSSAFLLASAARSTASAAPSLARAASAFASSACAPASASARFSAASLTLDEALIAQVAITPTTRLATSAAFAHAETDSAVPRDMRMCRHYDCRPAPSTPNAYRSDARRVWMIS
jgi:hypothetical protein